jgi:hypothetical protein
MDLVIADILHLFRVLRTVSSGLQSLMDPLAILSCRRLSLAHGYRVHRQRWPLSQMAKTTSPIARIAGTARKSRKRNQSSRMSPARSTRLELVALATYVHSRIPRSIEGVQRRFAHGSSRETATWVINVLWPIYCPDSLLEWIGRIRRHAN